MKPMRDIPRGARGFGIDQSGAAMVEFAIVSLVFFVSFFQLFDFGLFASNNLMAEKATQLAARIAVVRPSACGSGSLRARNEIGSVDTWHTGDPCNAGTLPGEVCAAPDNVSCLASAVDNTGDTYATADEIWARIAAILPPGTERSALRITYTYDENLGFLGGPYTPMVTVELTLTDFQFVSPITEWVIFGVNDGSNTMKYRVISVSLSAEDLNAGTQG